MLFETKENDLYTVSEFISLLNARIRGLDTSVVGEISELKISAKGHVYTTLKDKETGDILPCTIWGSDYVLSGIELELGMEVMVKGHPEFYGPFGKLSFHAKSVELVGEGQLKKAYDKLKKKLTSEGVFDESRKRPIPEFPEKIGVVTSLRGEAIHDFSNNLRRSGFKVKILHSPVEGPESGRSLTLSLRYLHNEEMDVLVIMRGGGSMQSLAGFDNEALVREIVSFPKPVIAGVGHHQDVPLAALAADASESTPSMVASRLNRSWEEAHHKLLRSKKDIFKKYEETLIAESSLMLKALSGAKEFLGDVFEHFKNNKRAILYGARSVKERIIGAKRELSVLGLHLVDKMTLSLENLGYTHLIGINERVNENYSRVLSSSYKKKKELERVITSSDPKRQLRLGYGIVRSGERIVKSKRGLKEGQELGIMVSDGEIISKIKKIK